MACACKGPKSSESAPKLLGKRGSECTDPRQVEVLSSVFGLRAGRLEWVCGVGVDTLLASGYLRLV